MASPANVGKIKASVFAGLRVSTRKVTYAREIAGAEYSTEYFGDVSHRIDRAYRHVTEFRNVTELFGFAQ
ncbi:MAG: hypothetical protein EVA87_14750 [Rhodospirillaceae bacterium]|nr:hypothetical protein [Rhodospirillaceae bacterium]RPG04221.1 MAG: hypothetical protein CBC23_000920 [Rhodospirillaceae bacterium TMED63]RZO34736.1 MAG: hypothetical protein EVA87_14750 [Rhodospirillaceae bacterium]